MLYPAEMLGRVTGFCESHSGITDIWFLFRLALIAAGHLTATAFQITENFLAPWGEVTILTDPGNIFQFKMNAHCISSQFDTSHSHNPCVHLCVTYVQQTCP